MESEQSCYFGKLARGFFEERGDLLAGRVALVADSRGNFERLDGHRLTAIASAATMSTRNTTTASDSSSR